MERYGGGQPARSAAAPGLEAAPGGSIELEERVVAFFEGMQIATPFLTGSSLGEVKVPCYGS